MLSRRNLVSEKWLAGIIAKVGPKRPATRTALIMARLAEEREELKRYESMENDGDIDIEEKVRVFVQK